MRFRPHLTERQLAQRGTLGFTGAILVLFLGLLISGWQPLASGAVDGRPGRLALEHPLILRQNTAFPACDGDDAIQGVQGQLVRNERARIIGLSDAHQVSAEPNGGRACQARVILDFGTQPIAYTIHRIGSGRSAWELQVLAH